jgi:hypothetical protein
LQACANTVGAVGLDVLIETQAGRGHGSHHWYRSDADTSSP